MDRKSLEKEVLDLPAEDRAKLALELIESLEVPTPVESEQLWLDEAARRARQIDEGSVALVPGDVVSTRARALLR